MGCGEKKLRGNGFFCPFVLSLSLFLSLRFSSSFSLLLTKDTFEGVEVLLAVGLHLRDYGPLHLDTLVVLVELGVLGDLRLANTHHELVSQSTECISHSLAFFFPTLSLPKKQKKEKRKKNRRLFLARFKKNRRLIILAIGMLKIERTRLFLAILIWLD
jgi:hypothetical protein